MPTFGSIFSRASTNLLLAAGYTGITNRNSNDSPEPNTHDYPAHALIDPILPLDFVKNKYPRGNAFHQFKTDANLFLTAGDPPRNGTLLGETWLTYALVAPFFTVQDDLTLANLRSLVRGYQPENLSVTIDTLLLRDQDNALVAHLFNMTASAIPPKSKIDHVIDGFFRPDVETKEDAWAILPFELLALQWKVISVDGKSPLDDDFTLKRPTDPADHPQHQTR